ncbi:MAG TPA: universal stress protein [Candidatus Limnocylindrales bacterium]|nr:universal stress protein [Candidatus Limnocylindrales bacterium]
MTAEAAVAMTDDRPPALERVLLATDLTAASIAATDEAFALAARLGATLLVVSVIDPGSLRLPGGRWAERVDQVRARREAAAEQLVERGRAMGVPVQCLVWVGEPGESIVEAADAEGADLILVGSHGRSGVGRVLLGSVSDFVVRHANCPVLVVRQRPKRAPAG